jgi:universal stress protein E
MKVRHIMVALADPKARVSAALVKAADLARRHDAQLTLFHSVYSPYVAGEQFYSPADQRRDIEAVVNERKAQLAKLVGTVAKAGERLHLRVRWDFPVHESIVREVLREQVDLLVVESHRHGRAARVFLSNTDWQLIRVCPCPVLFVKTTQPYSRLKVLAAVDPMHAHAKPEALDRQLLDAGRDLAELYGGRLHAAHCYQLPMPMLAGGLAQPVPLPVDVAAEYLKEVRTAFERLAQPYGLGPKRLHLAAGPAAEEIPSLAEKLDAGVVVMGAVSRSGLKRLFIGSTAERLIDHVRSDVLILKPAGFKTPVPKRPGYRPVVLPPM